jgi:Zn-dependent peptidase ImmA (M78 family)
MANRTSKRADQLLEEYIRSAQRGRPIDALDLLGRCRVDQRDELREAVVALDFLWRNHEPLLVRPELVERAQSRIRAGRERRERMARARAGLAEAGPMAALTAAGIRGLLRSVLSPFGEQGSDAIPSRRPEPQLQFRGGGRTGGSPAASSAAMHAMAEAAAAVEADRAWRAVGAPGPPVDPWAVAEALGLVVVEEELRDCDGCIATQGDLGVVVLSSSVEHRGRKRFTLAHEIGHFQLHRATLQFLGESASDIEANWVDERELGANVFASELLMPTELVTADFAHREPSFAYIQALADRYAVSLTAAARRLVGVSDFACALLYTAQGKVKWFAASSEFPWSLRPIVGDEPPADSDTAALMAGDEPANRSWATPVAWWCPDARVPDDAEVQEDARRIYGDHVLTLLYVRDTHVTGPDDDAWKSA